MHHIIFNPVAGKGRASAALSLSLEFLTDHDIQYQLHTTRGPDHATELAAATPQGSTVIAMGGDGTVHEVVKGLLNGVAVPVSDRTITRTLGVIPVGSGDDFAFSLGLQRGDVDAALKRIAVGTTRLVDLGLVGNEPFVNAVGVGFDAEVAHRVMTSPKLFKGPAAYFYGVVTALGSLSPASVTVTIDGERVFCGRSLLVACQNGPRTGGSFYFAPAARNDDGLLDVVVAGDFGRAGALRILPKVMKGAHLSDPRVRLFQGREVELLWERPQRAHAEGETIAPRTDYRISLQRRALRVIA